MKKFVMALFVATMVASNLCGMEANETADGKAAVTSVSTGVKGDGSKSEKIFKRDFFRLCRTNADGVKCAELRKGCAALIQATDKGCRSFLRNWVCCGNPRKAVSYMTVSAVLVTATVYGIPFVWPSVWVDAQALACALLAKYPWLNDFLVGLPTIGEYFTCNTAASSSTVAGVAGATAGATATVAVGAAGAGLMGDPVNNVGAEAAADAVGNANQDAAPAGHGEL